MGESYSESYSDIIRRKTDSLKSECLVFMSNNQAVLGLVKINRGLAIDPRDPSLFELRGECYFQLKNYPEAIHSISKALRLKPSNDENLMKRLDAFRGCYGDLLYSKNQYKEALKQFVKIYKALPQYLVKCIACYVHLKEFQPAIALLKSELEDGSLDNKAELLVMRARLSLLLGDATSCYYDVQSALQIEPLMSEGLALKGILEGKAYSARKQALHCSLSGKISDGIQRVNIAISSNPSNTEHQLLKGILHRELQLYNMALDDFVLAMEKCSHCIENPAYLEASKEIILTLNCIALNCFEEKKYSEAIILLNKAISERNDEFGLFINRGDCFFKQGECQLALNDYQQAYEMSPCTIDLQYRLAVVHYALGMKDLTSTGCISLAEDHFTAALEHCPFTPRLYVCRAKARMKLNKSMEAQDDVIISLLLSPTNSDCIPLLAELFPGISVQKVLNSEHAIKLQEKNGFVTTVGFNSPK